MILCPTTEYVLCQSFVLANCIESFGISDHSSFKSLFWGITPPTFVGIAFNSLFGFIQKFSGPRLATDSYYSVLIPSSMLFTTCQPFCSHFLSKWICMSSWSFGKNLYACVVCCHSLQNLSTSVSSIIAIFLVHHLFLNIFMRALLFCY